MGSRDYFDCTPQQYHHGLDILWSALPGNSAEMDGETAYHKVANYIGDLEVRLSTAEARVRELEEALTLVDAKVRYRNYNLCLDCDRPRECTELTGCLAANKVDPILKITDAALKTKETKV